MARILFLLAALLVAAASAFVAPANHAVSTPAFVRASTEAKMMSVEHVDVALSNVASTANLIATSAGDNGGYFYPVAGITLLAALILYLSPPLADE